MSPYAGAFQAEEHYHFAASVGSVDAERPANNRPGNGS